MLGLMVMGGKSKMNARFLAGPWEEGTINRHKEYREDQEMCHSPVEKMPGSTTETSPAATKRLFVLFFTYSRGSIPLQLSQMPSCLPFTSRCCPPIGNASILPPSSLVLPSYSPCSALSYMLSTVIVIYELCCIWRSLHLIQAPSEDVGGKTVCS